MKRFVFSLLVVVWTGAWQIASAGDVSGKITLDGTPPPEKNIVFDDSCGPVHPSITTTRHFVVGKDKGLADVFVYISKGLEGRKFTPPAEARIINQEGCAYLPLVTGVMVGQVLKFKNSDPILHNVHGLPTVNGNQEFNFAQPSQGDIDATKWTACITQPEVLVKIKCEVHSWMFCYVGVRDNPYFAVSDQDGNFKIPGLPPGDYTLTAYHLKATAGTPGISKQITVGAGPLTVDFTLKVPVAR
jgi:hypothetical protein